MLDRLKGSGRRAGKAIGYGTTIAGIATTLAGISQPMPPADQFRKISDVRLKETRLETRRKLEEQTRVKNQPTTSLVLKDLRKLDKKRR